jgi:hypothetical protein
LVCTLAWKSTLLPGGVPSGGVSPWMVGNAAHIDEPTSCAEWLTDVPVPVGASMSGLFGELIAVGESSAILSKSIGSVAVRDEGVFVLPPTATSV